MLQKISMITKKTMADINEIIVMTTIISHLTKKYRGLDIGRVLIQIVVAVHSPDNLAVVICPDWIIVSTTHQCFLSVLSPAASGSDKHLLAQLFLRKRKF